jgi:hypothetical protein
MIRTRSYVENEEWGHPELRDFCLVEQVLKNRELIGLLLSRAGQRLLLLGTSVSPIATESFRHLADQILVPKRPPWEHRSPPRAELANDAHKPSKLRYLQNPIQDNRAASVSERVPRKGRRGAAQAPAR